MNKEESAGKFFVKEASGRTIEELGVMNEELSRLTKEQVRKLASFTFNKYMFYWKKYGHKRHNITKKWKNKYRRFHAEYMKRNAQEMGIWN